jgi:VanZ family protein
LAYFVPWPGAGRVALRELPNLFLFQLVGVLLSGLGGRRWRDWDGWRWVLGLGLLLVGLIKFVQLFVVSRNRFALDVLTGGLSILLGWALGVAVHKSSPAEATGAGRGLWVPPRAPFVAALVGWAAVVAFLNWHPFDFAPDLGWAAGRLAGVSLLPFADYVAGSYFHALDQGVSRLALFLPAGLLLPAALGWQTNRAAGIRVVLLVAAWAVVIEVGQAFLPTRYPSLTDVLVETLGAWLGFWCARRLRAGGSFGGVKSRG